MSQAHSPKPRILITIPTYNEVDALPVLINQLRTDYPGITILVIDDNSPDGTGKLADSLAVNDTGINVLHRSGKKGLASAYISAFRWGEQHGYDWVCEMDADGSHHPRDLRRLLAQIPDSDLIIGARWIPGGQVPGWSLLRVWLSRLGNTYIRLMLGMKVHDATAGYRLYRVSQLPKLDLDTLGTRGYVFQAVATYRATVAGLRITEVPVKFSERIAGESKMNANIFTESLLIVTRWGIERLFQRFR